MSTLYHPTSRTVNLRDASGCLTPNQPELHKLYTSKSEDNTNATNVSSGNTLATTTTILSPPLSPYQRFPYSNEDLERSRSELIAKPKHFVASSQPFKVENYKSYNLVVNPWSNLDRHYKKRQFNFLEQYSIMSAREASQSLARVTEPRRRRRAPLANLSFGISDSDSESGIERVRTRRVAKESSVAPTDKEDSLSSVPSSPKRKRQRKETSYAGSPLALQQAALIDENIPDYSPDTSTLPKNNTRCLKVEWKGQPMDLRSDPNVDKLHPAEVLLASTLRLPCNVYLDSKRRLFYEKVMRMRNGMQFRRTDAQKACRIDVNKASRLFAAYEKVGWLEDSLFVKYL